MEKYVKKLEELFLGRYLRWQTQIPSWADAGICIFLAIFISFCLSPNPANFVWHKDKAKQWKEVLKIFLSNQQCTPLTPAYARKMLTYKQIWVWILKVRLIGPFPYVLVSLMMIFWLRFNLLFALSINNVCANIMIIIYILFLFFL